MAGPRVELNHGNVRKILRSPEMMRVLESSARKKINRPDVTSESFRGKNRDRVTLRASTPAAKDALKKAFVK